MRVFLLGGAGEVGQYASKHLASSSSITEVTIAGRNLERAKQTASACGEKFNSVKADSTDQNGLSQLIAGYDILLNTSGPDYLVMSPAVKAAIKAGVHYCDVSCDGPTTEEVLQITAKAKDAGITAIVGIGWGPGLDNLMMLHATRQFDQAESVHTCMALTFATLATGDTGKAAEDLRNSAPFSASWETFMRLVSGQCKVFQEKKWVTVDPFVSDVVIPNPKGGTVKMYPICGPQPITLPRSVPGLQNASVLASFVPFPLNSLAFKVASQVKSGAMGTRDAALAFIEGAGSERERWAPTLQEFPQDLWVMATGIKEGKRTRYTLVPTPGWMSTAGPLCAAAMKILTGKIKERGIFAPEQLLDPVPFMQEVASLEPGRPPGSKLYDESFEKLD